MNEHARRQCINTPGVYWKGAEVPCFYCGCQGKPAIPPTAKCAQTWHPDERPSRPRLPVTGVTL